MKTRSAHANAMETHGDTGTDGETKEQRNERRDNGELTAFQSTTAFKVARILKYV